MKKIVNIIISLKGDWTKSIEKVKRIENIPTDAVIISTYNADTETTTICFNYIEEGEVNAK